MEQKQLSKNFIKHHPLMKVSAYNISAVLIEHDVFEQVSSNAVMEKLPSEKREKVDADLARIEAADSVEEIATLFRKNLDMIVIQNLVDKALEHEEEVFPLLFKRYCTSSQTEMIEAAIRFFGRSKNNYSHQLLEAYDSIRDPYAQAQACVVIGLDRKSVV